MIKQYLELGTVVGTHGVRGEMRINPMCDTPDFAKQFKTVYLDAQGKKPVKVMSCRPHGNLILMRLEGVESIEQAEKMRNTVLFISRGDAALPEGTWFIEELTGCSVFDADTGREYGTLTEVMPMPANDVWTVTSENGREYLLPAIKSVIAGVDVAGCRIEIRPLKGIFDDEN